MAQCCSSYLVPEKVLSSNPLVSRWKALSQSLVGTTSLIPIWYHKSLEFSNQGSENIIISCVTRLCWLISQFQFLFGTTKVLSFKPHSRAGERKHCCVFFHKVWLDVISFITRPDLRSSQQVVNQFCLCVQKEKEKLLMFNQDSFSQIWRNFYPPINHNHMQKKHMKF